MSLQEKISLLLFVIPILAIYTFEFALFAAVLTARFTRRSPRKILLNKPAVALHVLALLGVACFLYARFIESHLVEVTRIDIPTRKLAAADFRIVQISDLHCDTEPFTEDKVIRMVNNLEPDIIVFTGDALRHPKGLPVFRRTMAALEAPLGKFAIYGNFDAPYRNDFDLFAETGFQLLQDRSVTVTKDGDRIVISGLDSDRRSRRNLPALLDPVPPDKFSILLHHTSNHIEDLAGLNVDLYLAGHTHGGQIALPFYGAIITLQKHGKKYESGLYRVDNTTLYVNRGIGFEARPAPKARFLAPPEITLLTLTPI